MKVQNLLASILFISAVVIFNEKAVSAEENFTSLDNSSVNKLVLPAQTSIDNPASMQQVQQKQHRLLLAQIVPGLEATSQENLFINTVNNTYEIFNSTSDTVTELTITTLTRDAIASFGSTGFIGRLNPTTNQFEQVITIVPATLETFVVLPGDNVTLVPGLAVQRTIGSADPSLTGATIINPTTNPQLVDSNGIVQPQITVITSNGPQGANVRLIDNAPAIEDNNLEVADGDYNDNPYTPQLVTTAIPIETVVTTNPLQTETQQLRTETATTTTGGEQVSGSYSFITQEQRLRQQESVTQSTSTVSDVQTSRSDIAAETGMHTFAPIVGETGRINPNGSPEQRARSIGAELNTGGFLDGGIIFNAEVIAALNEKAKNPVYAGLNLRVTEPEQRAVAFFQVQTPPTFTDRQGNTRAKDAILFGRVGAGIINQPEGNITIREYGERIITQTATTTTSIQDNLLNTFSQQTLATAAIQTTVTTNTIRDTTLTNAQSQTATNQYTSSLTGQTLVLSSTTGAASVTGSTTTSELIGSTSTTTTTPETAPVNVGEPTLMSTAVTSQVIGSNTETTEETGARQVVRREVDTDNRISHVVELRAGFAYKDFSVQNPGTFVASGSGVFQTTPDGESYGVGGRVGIVLAKPASNLNNTIYLSVDYTDGSAGSDTKVGVYVSLGRGLVAPAHESAISIPNAAAARSQAGVQ